MQICLRERWAARTLRLRPPFTSNVRNSRSFMEISQLFEYLGKGISLIAAIFGFYWAFERWRKREEHFPRINFDLEVEIIDHKNGQIIINVISTLENRGHVPLKIKEFVCELRGLTESDSLELGEVNIRKQLNFKRDLGGGPFIPLDWNYSFVYPTVKTNYTYVTIVPETTAYLFIKGRFNYLSSGESHHAGKIIKIPNKSSQSTQQSCAPA